MSVSSASARATAWRSLIILFGVAFAAVTIVQFTHAAQGPEPAVAIPAPAVDQAPGAKNPQTAVLAGGCFWGVQAVFEHLKGVSLVVAGYTGGHVPNPSYEQVSTEETGHAESVKILYDPSQVSYGTLLRVYFSVAHNPTELNRQGPDEGTSYRSNIFYTTPDQKRVAEAYIAQLDQAHVFPRPVVTRVDAFTAFYAAEGYHQDFLVKNPTYPYIVINDKPKLVNFQRLLPDLYRPQPVLTNGRT
ncbi:MAG TPA: peptide-methionine (S)-S-oxide reductase MsrA [Vicinamibacterales bacterium]|jgi:peptide-methionine (S)-S-oxide reductase|nr:peptide-methionine (S)-S-oxide reductase MsrA [Vicinamibacterales bacterium]